MRVEILLSFHHSGDLGLHARLLECKVRDGITCTPLSFDQRVEFVEEHPAGKDHSCSTCDLFPVAAQHRERDDDTAVTCFEGLVVPGDGRLGHAGVTVAPPSARTQLEVAPLPCAIITRVFEVS